MKRLFSWFFPGKENDDAFVTLMSVAATDAAIKSQLLAILDQPEFQRQSSLNTWINQLEIQNAPREFVDGLRYLLDDNTAERAIDLLRK